MPDLSRSSTSPTPSRARLFWQLQLIGWGAFALLALPIKQAVYAAWGTSLLITVYQLPLSLGLSGLLRLFYRRNRPDEQANWIAALVVFGGCLAAGAADVLASIAVNRLTGLDDTPLIPETGLYAFRSAVYLIWSLVYFLTKALLRNRALAFQSAVADEQHRLELMRYQLNPNFLARSLSAISHQIGVNPASARAMTARLAEFYQNTLRHTERGQTATIGDELALVRAYLDIEQLRRGEGSLQVNYAVEESLLSLPLPPVLLLPLAEKAVHSGGRTDGKPLEITLTIQRADQGQVLLEISHSGRLDRSNPPFTRAGDPVAPDIRATLEQHFPGRHRFSLSQDSFRVRASVWLPLTG
jgi:two-component system LytT family sensor kinase